ncbi:SIR2 family protein [Agromyces sp. NPDC056389]
MNDADGTWITGDVRLPEAVIRAHTEGTLVFFVGAGASMDDPSNLPLFSDLAQQLAEMAHVPFDKDAAVDFFLGSMPEDFDTHLHARDLIANESSAPNPTHQVLVRVATAKGQMRIVTTNFDDHLSVAAASRDIEVADKWIGPALPLGDDFCGIVHLHGSVLRDPRELVLTDSDFGRAYLTHAWATRFLMSMFQKFTVLFVGYSHDDPIMRYLGLGLPTGTPRFAFTSIDRVGDPKWARLKVKTIGYPVVGRDHGALVAALGAWDARSRMGQTEHLAQMTQIVNAGPTLTPVDRDYLAVRLKSVQGAREFAHATTSLGPDRQVEWLRWVEEFPDFKKIFIGEDGSDAAPTLSYWFCQTFVISPDLHGAALQTVLRLGQAFSLGLFRDACFAADELRKLDPEAGRRWKAILSTSIRGHSAPVATEFLLSYMPDDHTEHVSVLRSALRPSLSLKRRWSFSESENMTRPPDAEVYWTTAPESLAAHIAGAVDARPPGDPVLAAILEDALSAGYDLLEAYHGDQHWDSLSFGRSAIEPHEQDRHRDQVDAMIDGLRTFGEKALSSHPDLIETWWALGRTLFQRLALHLIAIDESRTSDQKLQWILDRSLLFASDVRHETYGVLRVAIKSASGPFRERILDVASGGPDLSDDVPDAERRKAHGTYRLLAWLVMVQPDWTEAVQLLAASQESNPGFSPSEHPDLDHWTTTGTWGGKLPVEPDEFEAAVDEDPTEALDELLAHDYSEQDFDQPTWHEALTLVSRLAESRPDLGDRIWTAIESRTDLDTRCELLRAIIEGWAKADAARLAEPIFDRVEGQISDPESADAIGRFLLDQIRKRVDDDDSSALAALRRIAQILWQEQGEAFRHADDVDPVAIVSLYLNSWPGALTQYWMSEIDRRWRSDRDGWAGLSDDESTALTALLGGSRYARDATQPAVAAELYFMFAADPDFTIQHILPLFLDVETAKLAWTPFLYGPRYDDRLLAAGLLEGLTVEWDRLSSLDHELRKQFFGLTASVVSFAGIDADARQALLDRSVLAGGGAYAADFASCTVQLAASEGVDGAEIWNLWLRDHLRKRIAGVPRIAGAPELTSWADVVPHLGTAIPEATELLRNSQIGLGEDFLSPVFAEGVIAEHGNALVEHYVGRVRNTSNSGRRLQFQLQELIASLRTVLGDEAIEPLAVACADGGFLSR